MTVIVVKLCILIPTLELYALILSLVTFDLYLGHRLTI